MVFWNISVVVDNVQFIHTFTNEDEAIEMVNKLAIDSDTVITTDSPLIRLPAAAVITEVLMERHNDGEANTSQIGNPNRLAGSITTTLGNPNRQAGSIIMNQRHGQY
jgi:hypothetical protein